MFRIWLSVSCGKKPATLPYFLFPEMIRVTKAREEKTKNKKHQPDELLWEFVVHVGLPHDIMQ